MTSTFTLLAQELWDEIVDHLQGRTDDLKSLSLTHRRFLPRAQSHTFRSITVWNARKAGAGGIARRLLDVMTSSPHLIRHVQILNVFAGDPKSLQSLARIPWSHVDQLTLMPMAAEALGYAGILVGMPSLRSLVFRPYTWDTTFLFNIFAQCAPGVKVFTFVDYTPTSKPTPSTALTTTCVKPTHLFMLASSRVFDLLVDPRSPLDLSAVVDFRCTDFSNPRLGILLSRISPSLTHLHVVGNDRTLDNLELELLPRLDHIDAFGIGPPLVHLLKRLPAESRITTLTFAHFEQTVDDELESVLLAIPTLQHVNMRVDGKGLEWNAVQRHYESELPRLHESGLLSVQFLSSEGAGLFLPELRI
ncbi:hypothetical protein FB45DRAFT_931437 [Roridomyces roridus]|uniref:Uncharacterized protein n=1 Tax=Roridomyces roridus TaxID=1738132 RepID=A0AAD7BG61_9AGAR|nr:hypothetical protein FB45DRAFT_931437 [Roridomyces roridus]